MKKTEQAEARAEGAERERDEKAVEADKLHAWGRQITLDWEADQQKLTARAEQAEARVEAVESLCESSQTGMVSVTALRRALSREQEPS